MTAYDGVSIVLLPFSIVLAACTLPRQWRAWCTARQRDERLYWQLTGAGHAVASFGLFFSSLRMLDQLLDGPLHALAWWPSPARLLNLPAWGDDVALLDGLLSVGLGLVAMLAASYFGYVDELGEWCRPPWRASANKSTSEEPHEDKGQ